MWSLQASGEQAAPPLQPEENDDARPSRGRTWFRRAAQWSRRSWVDIAWVVFVGVNLLAMHLVPQWQTVPFLAIWVSLTAIYGVRLWKLQPTILTLAAVTLATGGIILIQVIKGQQDADYLAEVPLIALMFLVMVWHGQRRQIALHERLTAMEQVQKVSEENLRLLEQQRRFLQDASHELGTPITVALGHVELIQAAVSEPEVAEDVRVVAGELARLRRLAGRLLLLASASSPDFLRVEPVAADSLVLDAMERWGHQPRRWRLGEIAEVTVVGDRDRLAVALDALLENAVAHTVESDRIEVSAHRDAVGRVVFTVEDSGCGIPAADMDRIFGRFARARPFRSRVVGGFGLGLPIVDAIAHAHKGGVRVRSVEGHGSTFEMLIPVMRASASGPLPASGLPAASRLPAALSPPPESGSLPAPGPSAGSSLLPAPGPSAESGPLPASDQAHASSSPASTSAGAPRTHSSESA